jgi:hypothetical protein
MTVKDIYQFLALDASRPAALLDTDDPAAYFP